MSSLRDRFEDILSASSEKDSLAIPRVPVDEAPAPPAPQPAMSMCAAPTPTTTPSPFGSKLIILGALLLALVLAYCVYTYIRRPDVPDPPDLDTLPDVSDHDDDAPTDVQEEEEEEDDEDVPQPPVRRASRGAKRAPPPAVKSDPMFQVLEIHRHSRGS